MHLISFHTQNDSSPQIGVLDGDQVFPMSVSGSVLQLKRFDLMHACEQARSVSAIPLASVNAIGLPEAPIWAAGVTYERSMKARMEESTQKDVYDKVYDADRPEIFLKSMGPARANGEAITIRSDSTWDVPEPELTVVVNSHREVIGYTVGNDLSSRSIEGENPLYLPQAKIWDGSAAIGPVIRLVTPDLDPENLTITLEIEREGTVVFSGETSSNRLHRKLSDLVDWLHRGTTFDRGVYLMTGTGIVPPDAFTLAAGDTVSISIESIGTLVNQVLELDVQTNRIK